MHKDSDIIVFEIYKRVIIIGKMLSQLTNNTNKTTMSHDLLCAENVHLRVFCFTFSRSVALLCNLKIRFENQYLTIFDTQNEL